MSKKRLSHDQKRKAKLAREAKRHREPPSLAYEGNKYKTDEFTPVFFETELAIYEVYVLTDRKLTDRAVRSALEKLVLQMRRGPLPPLEEGAAIELTPGQEEELIVPRIRSHWKELAPRPRPDDLIGVVRTLLNSINVWTSPGPESRGYLHYIEGFLKKQGVSVDKVSPEGGVLPGPEEHELLEIGRAWCHEGHREAHDDFFDLAEEMIDTGEAETVVSVCHRLMGEAKPGRTMEELMAVSLKAQQALGPTGAEQVPPQARLTRAAHEEHHEKDNQD